MAESTENRKKKEKKEHGIRMFKFPCVRCACGWVYHLQCPDEWGNSAGKDHMLDMYNLHKSAGK